MPGVVVPSSCRFRGELCVINAITHNVPEKKKKDVCAVLIEEIQFTCREKSKEKVRIRKAKKN